MCHRSSILVGLAIAGLLIALPGSAGAAPGGKVTTTLTITFPTFPFDTRLGEIHATFRAAPAGDGTWLVDATFRPHEFYILVGSEFIFRVQVRGTASATSSAVPGVPVTVTASGMTFPNPFTGEQQAYPLTCTFTVSPEGVVSVQSI